MKLLLPATLTFSMAFVVAACSESSTQAPGAAGGAVPVSQAPAAAPARQVPNDVDAKKDAIRRELEEKVAYSLKDPGSAQFRNFNITPDLRQACLEYNAKNSVGGYVGFRREDYKLSNGKFVRDYAGGSREACTASSAATLLQLGDAMNKAFAESLTLVSAAKKMDEPATRAYIDAREPCKDAFGEFGRHRGQMYFRKAQAGAADSKESSVEFMKVEASLKKVLLQQCR